MNSRRKFLLQSFVGAMAAGLGCRYGYAAHVLAKPDASSAPDSLPVIISTWRHGLDANAMAWKVLQQGGSVLDAVEKGVMVSEADPEVTSVGYGGLPDANGKVTLDACIMGSDGNAGAVACLENIMHPVAVARLVMEKTPHVMLAGKGAQDFALRNGFVKTNLLTNASKQAYKKWKQSGARYAPQANWENHDTIGLIAIDSNAQLAGACTTSGMAFKHHGRIGDSPIIGAGLFVDNTVGAATATGEGEAVMKTLGSFLVVELMRNGASPQKACEEAVQRIAKSSIVHPAMQIGYVAVNKAGEVGAFALKPGFQYAVHNQSGNMLFDADCLIKS